MSMRFTKIANFLIYILPTGRFWFLVKRWLLRISGAKVGQNVQIWQGVRIMNLQTVSIGNNVAIGYDVLLQGNGELIIGDRVLIGHGTKIITSNHVIPPNRQPIWGAGHVHKSVKIEDDVWIAANVIILPGVTIGKGSVVAAGAVVTKDVKPYTIVGGSPAIVIKER